MHAVLLMSDHEMQLLIKQTYSKYNIYYNSSTPISYRIWISIQLKY